MAMIDPSALPWFAWAAICATALTLGILPILYE